jgi:hypothetical protein
VPIAWRTWEPEKVRAVVAHELAHVRRRDPLVIFFAAVNKAIFWFHPLAWWLERRLAELAEFAADEVAVKVTHDPHAYAEALIGIASAAGPVRLRWSAGSVDFARRSVQCISRRLDRIFDSGTRVNSTKVLWAAATMIAAISLVQFQRPMRAQEPAAQALIPRLGHSDNTFGPFQSKLSPEEAAARERQLAANPEDEKARLDLSVYYHHTHQNERRLQLIYWLIERHPESPLHSYMSMAVSPARDGLLEYNAALERWRVQVAIHPDDRVLLNAGKAFLESSFGAAIALFETGQALDHAQFTPLIARLYSTALSVASGDHNGFRANATELAALRKDLASSADALLLGMTGTMLVKDAAQNGLTHHQHYDFASIRSTALDLLSHAQSLDPANQEWPDTMEGARELERFVAPRPAAPF